MSWLTSLALSFNDLRTKKARTLLTAFAGSIGIIGIALIISLSTGVNAYIADMERSTLSEYPLQILSSGVDITSFLSSGSSDGTTATGLPTDEDGKKDTSGGMEGMVSVRQLITKMVSGLTSNDLTSLKNISTATSPPLRMTPPPLSIPTASRPRSTGRTPTAVCIRSTQTPPSRCWVWEARVPAPPPSPAV